MPPKIANAFLLVTATWLLAVQVSTSHLVRTPSDRSPSEMVNKMMFKRNHNGWYAEHCSAPGQRMNVIQACEGQTLIGCTSRRHANDRCSVTVECSPPTDDSVWHGMDLCQAVCWANENAVGWLPAFYSLMHSIHVDFEVTAFGHEAVLDSMTTSGTNGTAAINFVRRFLQRQDNALNRLAAFRVRSRIQDCERLL